MLNNKIEPSPVSTLDETSNDKAMISLIGEINAYLTDIEALKKTLLLDTITPEQVTETNDIISQLMDQTDDLLQTVNFQDTNAQIHKKFIETIHRYQRIKNKEFDFSRIYFNAKPEIIMNSCRNLSQLEKLEKDLESHQKRNWIFCLISVALVIIACLIVWWFTFPQFHPYKK